MLRWGSIFCQVVVRDQSLITYRSWVMGGGGGATKPEGGGGGTGSFTPMKRWWWGGGGGVFSHAEGEVTNSFGLVLTWELDVLAILKGDAKSYYPLKGGGHDKFYPVLRVGGCAKCFRPAIIPYCSPHPTILQGSR